MNYFTNDDIMRLESKAAKIRKEVVKMLCMAKMGHPGGSLSEVEILTTLYYHILNIDPKNPTRPLCIIQRTWKSDIVYDSC